MKLTTFLYSLKKSAGIGLLSLLFFISIHSFSQPVVVTHPSDTSICNESSADFRIVAVNTSGYQWQENDGVGWYDLTIDFTYIEGQFTPVLTVNDANLGLNGYFYRCVVSDGITTDTSGAALLNVFEPPIITQDPLDDQVCKNDIAVFSVEAINGTFYQWQENSGVGWISLNDNNFYSGSETADLGIFTTTGMNSFKYRCIVTHVSCPDTSDFAVLFVDPTPIIFTLTGGGEYCAGNSGVNIGLDGSEIGISYGLVLDDIPTGIVREGIGGPLDFGTMGTAGNYTAVGYNQFSGCSVGMSSTALVIENPLPSDFPIQGGGSICEGEEGENIFLLSSETDVTYYLYRNGEFSGNQIEGSGFTISFGNQSQEGFYTVLATNSLTSCSSQMSGNAQIIVNSVPIALAGDDKYITQGNTVLLNGTASNGSGNFNYEWSPSNLCITPSSPSTQTIPLFISSLFSFKVYDNQTECASLSDTVVVYVNNGPLSVQAFSDDNNICIGESINLMAIPAGGNGNYSYLWTSSPPGFTSTVQNPNIIPSTSTVYFLELSDGQETAFDSVSIFVNSLPGVFSLQGGGAYCFNYGGKEITLNNSELETSYYLYQDQNMVGEQLGTGHSFSFGTFEEEAIYSAIAISNATNCSSEQNGEIQISINELPIAEAGQNQYISSGGNANFSGSASGGSGSYSFAWSPADSLFNPNIQNPSSKPLYSTNVFYLTVTDGNGCKSAEDNVIAFVSGGEINIEIIASDYPVCSGGDVQLFALASGGSGSFTYIWQSNPSGFTSSIFNPLITPTTNTWYKVIVSDGLQTIADSIYISTNPNPLAFDVLGGGSYCQGSSSPEISLQSSELQTDYQLFIDGVQTQTNLQGTAYALNFGQYPLSGEYSIMATSQLTGCSSQMNNSVTVVAVEPAMVNAGLDQTVSLGSSTSLSGEITNGSGLYEYIWKPSHLCVTPNNQNTITTNIYIPASFSFQVIDTESGCASNIDSVNIFTSGGSLFAFAVAESGTICEGSSTQINASAGGGTGNYSYSWTSSPQGIYSNESSINIQPQIPTTYYLNVFDGIINAYDTVEVLISDNPVTYSITGGGDYCQGEDGVNIGLSNSQSDIEYSLYLFPDNFIISATGNNSSINFGDFQQSGNYFVEAINNQNCISQMNGQASITRNIPPNANAGSDKEISYGEITLLNGSGNGGSESYNFLWSPGDSIVNPSSQDALTHELHKTTQFELTISDAQTNCQGGQNDNVVVFVSGGILDMDLLSSKSVVCPDEQFQLFAMATGGSGNYTYAWVSQPAGFASYIYNPLIQQNQTTTYTVTLNDGINTVSKSIQIEVSDLPLAFELSGGGEICPGEYPDEIILQSSEINTTYQLLHNNILTGFEKAGNGFALNFGIWEEEGNYEVIAENNQNNCTNQMGGNVTVIENEIPIANAGSDDLIIAGTTSILNGNATNGSGSYSYSWSPANMVQNPDNQNTQTNVIDQTTWFTLNVDDIITLCSAIEDTVFIFVEGGNLSAITESSSTEICEGETFSLLGTGSGGTGNFFYSWTSEPEGFYSNIFNPTISIIETTTFYLQVFDGLSYAIDSVEIIAKPIPQTFDILGGGEFCQGQAGVSISLSGSQNNVDYTLFQNPEIEINTLSGTGQTLNFGYIDSHGSYYIIANEDQSCSKPMNGEVYIQQNPLPVAQAGQDFNIEYGNQITLNGNASGGSGDYLYNWTPADSLVNNNIQNPLTVPLYITTIFTLSVTDANTACEGIENDATVVFVAGGPFVSHTTIDNNLICPEEEIQLYCLASGGSGDYSFLWESVPSGFTSTEYNPIANPTVSTIYYVNISDGSGIITDSVAVTVNPAPLAFNLLGGGEYCANDDGVVISLNNSEIGINYNLFNSNGFTGLTVAGNNGPISFGLQTEEGEYFVIGENILSLCTSEMNNTASVIINEVPIANAGPNQIILAGETTQLSGNGSGGSGVYLYNWSPDYLLENANDQNPYTLALSTSTSFLLNVIDNQTNCISTVDTVVVITIGGPLEVTAKASKINVCKGLSGQICALASGGEGNYVFQWTSVPEGFESDIGNPYVYPLVSTWYFIELTDGDQTAIDSVLIEVGSKPEVFQLNGGGEFCMGDDGKSIILNSSEPQTVYQLYRNGDVLVNEKIGNGNSINFGDYTINGTYTSRAYIIESSCMSNMIGSAVIIQNPIPIAHAGPDKFTEPGGNATLNGNASNGSGSYLYNWTPVNKLINPNDQNPTTTAINQSTLFNLSVSDQFTGCTSLESGAIVFVTGDIPLSVEIISQSENVCPGEETSLIAIPTGGNGSYTYYWTSNPSGFISSENEITINPSSNTWFIVTVSDGVETIKDSIVLNTLAVPTSYGLSGGGGYCPDEQGVNIYLDGSESGVTYSLYHNVQSIGINLAGTGSSLNFGNMITEGNYSVKAIGQNQCSSLMSNSVQVAQNKKPISFQLFGGGIYCDNDPSLGILLRSSEMNVNYELYRDAINTGISRLGNGLPLSFTQLFGNGIYTVTATNILSSCFENMNGAIPMLIHESPDISISGDTELCFGDTTILTASGGINYIWNTYPQQETAAIRVSPEFNTVYTVVSTNNNNCSDIDSIKVEVFEQPIISLVNDLLSYSVICSPDGLETYEFYHGNEIVQSGSSNILFYGDLSLDADTMRVVGISSSGCSDIASIFLEIGEAPSAFTPNGDGKNDRFMTGRDITVYSRWGKEIYSGTDGWDGRYNGKIVTPGTYYYVHFISNIDGDVIKTNKGSVTLVIR